MSFLKTGFFFFRSSLSKIIWLLLSGFLLSCTGGGAGTANVPVNCTCAGNDGTPHVISANSVTQAEAECTAKGAGYIIRRCEKR